MAKIDLHKLALAVGFEVVCVEEDYINYCCGAHCGICGL